MKERDLVHGNIFKSLLFLSLPILGTSFIQMAYNMIDMIWIGRIGSDAVAAVGTAGFFTWFGSAFIFISRIGTEVGISHSIGRGDKKAQNKYVYNGILINIVIALGYTVFLLIFRNQLIGFFNLGNDEIIQLAIIYLVIIAFGIVFNFINPLFTGIFNGSGDSKTPFIINTVGLIANIILDPILIFGFGPIPAMGVAGAAIATVFAQVIVTIIFIIYLIKRGYDFKLSNKKYIDMEYINQICKLGIPAAVQNGLFAIFGMIIGRIISEWGATTIAVQKVGSQIESISWMTAQGFSTALTAFIGQNYGAKKYDRILKGYVATIIISSLVGVFATILLVFFGDSVFRIFITEQDAVNQGANYLKILGYSQLFMCLEITTAGAFAGLGNTMTPSIVGTILTGARIPACLYLSSLPFLGIDGVWWSISISSIFKGIIVFGLFYYLVIRKYRTNNLM